MALPLQGASQPHSGTHEAGALHVAFTSVDGLNINGHFGSCPLFFIYQVTPGHSQLIDIRRYVQSGKGAEVNEEKALMLAGCHLPSSIAIAVRLRPE